VHNRHRKGDEHGIGPGSTRFCRSFELLSGRLNVGSAWATRTFTLRKHPTCGLPSQLFRPYGKPPESRRSTILFSIARAVLRPVRFTQQVPSEAGVRGWKTVAPDRSSPQRPLNRGPIAPLFPRFGSASGSYHGLRHRNNAACRTCCGLQKPAVFIEGRDTCQLRIDAPARPGCPS
jgi:hypothetical protein